LLDWVIGIIALLKDWSVGKWVGESFKVWFFIEDVNRQGYIEDWFSSKEVWADFLENELEDILL
jgi:hypothetical protein